MFPYPKGKVKTISELSMTKELCFDISDIGSFDMPVKERENAHITKSIDLISIYGKEWQSKFTVSMKIGEKEKIKLCDRLEKHSFKTSTVAIYDGMFSHKPKPLLSNLPSLIKETSLSIKYKVFQWAMSIITIIIMVLNEL